MLLKIKVTGFGLTSVLCLIQAVKNRPLPEVLLSADIHPMYVLSTSHYGASQRRVASQAILHCTTSHTVTDCLPAHAAPLIHTWSYPFLSFVRFMPNKPCPTLGCQAWTANVRGQWYDVKTEYSLQLDEAKLAQHQRVCNNCWNRHQNPTLRLDGRIRKPTLFDQLLDAAALPLRAPPPLTFPVKQLTPRRRWTLKEKTRICQEWGEADTTAEKLAIKDKHRAEQLDGYQVQQWREALAQNSVSPKGKKAAKHEVKLRGAGRSPQLSEEQEAKVDVWVAEQRQKRLQVLVCQIQHVAATDVSYVSRWSDCVQGRVEVGELFHGATPVDSTAGNDQQGRDHFQHAHLQVPLPQ